MSCVSTGWSRPKRARIAAMPSAVAVPDSLASTSAASPGTSCSSRKLRTTMPRMVGPACSAVRRRLAATRRYILIRANYAST